MDDIPIRFMSQDHAPVLISEGFLFLLSYQIFYVLSASIHRLMDSSFSVDDLIYK